MIDPQSSFVYFTNSLAKKLQYMGALKSSDSVFYYSQGKQLANSFRTMGEVYDMYRSPDGWLEIQVQIQATL